LPATQDGIRENEQNPSLAQGNVDATDSLHPSTGFTQPRCSYRDSDQSELLCLGAVSNTTF
jgi:hypothetical protein